MAVDFSTSNRTYYEAAADASAQGANITVCAWINAINFSTIQQLFTRDESSSGDRVYQFRTTTGSKVQFIPFSGGANGSSTSTTSISTGSWAFIAARYDGTTSHTFVNSGGAEGADTTISGNLDSDVTGISLGSRSLWNTPLAFSEYSNHRMAEVAEFNRALTDDEMLSLAAGFSPLFFAGDLVWYASLINHVDPQRSLVSPDTFDVNTNAPTTFPHPPMIYPYSYRNLARENIGGGAVTLTPGVVGMGLAVAGTPEVAYDVVLTPNPVVMSLTAVDPVVDLTLKPEPMEMPLAAQDLARGGSQVVDSPPEMGLAVAAPLVSLDLAPESVGMGLEVNDLVSITYDTLILPEPLAMEIKTVGRFDEVRILDIDREMYTTRASKRTRTIFI